ncbi:MAG: hypothetical protein ACPHQR_05480, partial [Candidatus Poseidoniaceae archaeon]
DAVRDGIISSFEGRSLLELQHLLDYTDEQVAIIAARSSARRAVRRGRVSQAQLDFLMRGLPLIDGEWTVVAGLSPGKIPKEHRQLMVNLHHAFTEAAGRPVEHVLEEA